MNELDGFVVYEPDKKPAFIRAQKKAVLLSAQAYRDLGEPEFVNVFLDDVKRRVMIKKAEKNFANVLQCVPHNAGKNFCLCRAELSKIVADLVGEDRVLGHLVGEGTMIFERAK